MTINPFTTPHITYDMKSIHPVGLTLLYRGFTMKGPSQTQKKYQNEDNINFTLTYSLDVKLDCWHSQKKVFKADVNRELESSRLQ